MELPHLLGLGFIIMMISLIYIDKQEKKLEKIEGRKEYIKECSKEMEGYKCIENWQKIINKE